jgi:hypothetical protein
MVRAFSSSGAAVPPSGGTEMAFFISSIRRSVDRWDDSDAFLKGASYEEAA